jgi:hypothetical protein
VRKAIATLAIGERFWTAWSTIVEPNWRRYALRHGYDVVCFDKPLDESERAQGRSPAWQKLLIHGRPELAAYDAVVWLDTDILMNVARAPCIASAPVTCKIGLCKEDMSLPDVPLFALFGERIKKNQRALRKRAGIPDGISRYEQFGLPDVGTLFNTGVMVLRHREHRELLEHVYERYDYKGPGHFYEQTPLSWEIVTRDLHEVLDPKFNVFLLPFVHAFIRAADTTHPILNGQAALTRAVLAASYFLHFAGLEFPPDYLEFLDLDHDPVRLRPRRMVHALRRAMAAGSAAGASPRRP